VSAVDRLRSRPLIASLTALVLVFLCGAVLLTSGSSTKTVTAEFSRTVGLFEGSDVRVMGMRVGEVTKIVPHGTHVTVEISYDSQYNLPANVKAVLIAPSVIADRFVQLAPGYVDGPVLASGSVIHELDTRVPVELDQSLKVTTDLATALGPNGANKNGALAAALNTMASVLEGTGKPTRQALHDLAAATDVISASAGQISGTVKKLAGLTGTLAQYDVDVRSFDERLSSVSGSLATDSGRLSDLLVTLARSLGEVTGFVEKNRDLLTTDVGQLASVAGALVTERKALTQVLDIAPLAFTDLTETYDAQAQAVRTRANFGEIARVVDVVICDTLRKQAGPGIVPLCAALKKVFDKLPLRNGSGAVPTSTGGAAASPNAPVTGLLAQFSAPLIGSAR
jgi:phospholipid/cholesterol/gamma-HCH transport system substrate-binding protein